MRNLRASAGLGIEQVEALVVKVGRDIVVVFGGGNKYHIGASALAVARPSLSESCPNSSSCSVLCVTGHKEDELARIAALRLSARFSCVVNVAVGLHIDNASNDQIKGLVSNYYHCLDMVEEILDKE